MSNTHKTLYTRPMDAEAVDKFAESGELALLKQKTGYNADDPAAAAQDTQTPVAATSEEESYKERWINSKKYYDTEIHKARERIKDLEAEPRDAFVPPKTAEELEAFREKNQDAYDAMLTLAHEQGGQFTEKLSAEVTKLKADLSEANVQRALERIKNAHPDYHDIVNSNTFTAWLDMQAPDVRSWIEENQNNADTFIRALDLYKMDTQGVIPNKDAQKSTPKSAPVPSAADDIPVTGGATADAGGNHDKIWTREEIGKLHPSQYAKYEAEIDKAHLEGRIR